MRPLARAVIVCSLTVTACTGTNPVGDPTTTTRPSDSTTTQPVATTSTTELAATLDLSGARWVTHGPDGIHSSDGTSILQTQPFPAGIARDHMGGLVFTDSRGLWWLPSGQADPALIDETTSELIGVVDTTDGPVVMVWDGGPVYYDLESGELTEEPPDPRIEVQPDEPWVTRRTAGNGLTAWITDPDVEIDQEGQPSEIHEPAHLVVARDGETLFDIPIGSVYEEWARLHDFDGRTLIVSRGPHEPAMPEETYLVIDLAEGDITGSFLAGGTQATLVGADIDWDGPVRTPDLDGYAYRLLASDQGVTRLPDGRHLVYVKGANADGSQLGLDLAVWFSGNAANTAARLDGRTDIPVPNDYHIRNEDSTVIWMPIHREIEVTSVWFDYDTDPDFENDPIDYTDFLGVVTSDEGGPRSQLRHSPWWVTIEDGEVVALDEQYVP